MQMLVTAGIFVRSAHGTLLYKLHVMCASSNLHIRSRSLNNSLSRSRMLGKLSKTMNNCIATTSVHGCWHSCYAGIYCKNRTGMGRGRRVGTLDIG